MRLNRRHNQNANLTLLNPASLSNVSSTTPNPQSTPSMQSSGFTSTPTTLALLLLLTTLSLLTSITSTKHHLPLRPTPDLYPYLQFHRLLTHQLAYTSSTDLLFSSVLLYHLRVLERLFGTRKFASFILVAVFWNAGLTPLILAVVVRPLSWGSWNHLPAGATGLIFAALAVWSEEVPRLWTWDLMLSPPRSGPSPRATRDGSGTSGNEATAERAGKREAEKAWTITFSDKSPTYLLSIQLSLTQFPHSLLPAAIGYLIGMAWVGDFLPGRMSGWRVPRWMVGEAAISIPIPVLGRVKEGWGSGSGAGGGGGRVERERYEGLRRRLEEEGGLGRDGDADGMRQVAHATTMASGQGAGVEATRRPMGAQIADYFRGVF